MCLSVLSLTVSLFVSLSVRLSSTISFSLFLSVSACVSVSLSLCLTLCLTLSLSLSLCLLRMGKAATARRRSSPASSASPATATAVPRASQLHWLLKSEPGEHIIRGAAAASALDAAHYGGALVLNTCRICDEAQQESVWAPCVCVGARAVRSMGMPM